MNTIPIILCLDDERIVLDSLRGELLRNFGANYMYEFVESPAEAMEVIEEYYESNEVVILVISDWLMPEMKGDEFLIQLHKEYPGIVSIMLTGQADPQAIERAKREANLFACIAKPWSEKELIESMIGAIQSQHLN